MRLCHRQGRHGTHGHDALSLRRREQASRWYGVERINGRTARSVVSTGAKVALPEELHAEQRAPGHPENVARARNRHHGVVQCGIADSRHLTDEG